MRAWVVGTFISAICAAAVSSHAAVLSSYNFSDTGMLSSSSGASSWSPNIAPSRVAIVGMNTSFSNWNGALVTDDYSVDTLDTSAYFEWSLAPSTNYKMTLTSVQFRYTQSGGCNAFRLRSSRDGYSGNLFSATFVPDSTVTSYSTNLSGFTDITSTVTFRMYPYNSQYSGGYYGLAESLAVNGTVVAVPEPTFLGISVLLLPLLGRRREEND